MGKFCIFLLYVASSSGFEVLKELFCVCLSLL